MTCMTTESSIDSRAVNGRFVEHVVWGQELSVCGPIGARTSGELRSALLDAIDAGQGELFLHLADAEVWDSTGLGVIVGAHHRATQRGRTLVIVDASPRLVRLVRRTRLERVMDIRLAADPDSAARALAAIA